MLLILIPTAWLAIATLVVCLCRIAAAADTDLAASCRADGARGQSLRETTHTARRLREQSSGHTRRAPAQRRRLATHT
jgi:hypothetical protein